MRVLYIVYWGALEPLGRALVVPSVSRLAQLGARITLVTYEKPADMDRDADVKKVDATLRATGVRWVPLRYHKSPKVPATVFDVAHGLARGGIDGRGADVIHARTFVGGLTGLPLSGITRTKLIYHNEGFYPDEQVDAGFWAEGSRPHRIAKRLEERLYSRADAIFSLSEKGKEIIEALDAVRNRQTPIVVVPSSVDLEHFRPRERDVADGPLRLVYMGSVGGRYLVDRIGRFTALADARLEVLSPADRALVQSELRSGGLETDAWSSKFVPYDQLPDELVRYDAGFCFHTHTLSAAGGSSTKVGQYWAMGLPVIATRGLGDVDAIVASERVGVVVRDHTDDAYRAALDELRPLLADSDLAARCRAAAERHYGLDEACRRQFAAYEQLA
ncbi:MAG TPA: glycosyltransferase [Thermoleophilaceae bacterium]|nr:glycosyltransferase [Thermoleophilaceae bacterium]